jgi:hypothetical protein
VITPGLAWVRILAIVILSVVPANERPTPGAAPGFAHLTAFGLVADVFAIGYRLSLMRLLLMALLFCGGIELLQVPLPTRHPRLSDFIVDVGGAWAAMCLVATSDRLSVVERLRRQRRERAA